MSKIQIINSKGHWAAGWFGKPERIKVLTDTVLNKAKFEVKVDEVASITDLKILLDSLSSDTLVWTNAYYVDTKNGDTVWLNEWVENMNLPLFGSKAQTLQNLLEKDTCQTILNEHNIPIPKFAVLPSENANRLKEFLLDCTINYPLVLKPTSSCLSLGVCLVKNYKEALEKAQKTLSDFPDSNLIVEEFLPNDDITCGYLELGEDILLMPTHYGYRNKPGKEHIYNFDDRLIIDNVHRYRSVVSEEYLRDQLEERIPQIVQALDIRDITRIDGRQDKNGTLRYFDINGFPGLSFKGVISDIVAVCFLFFPDYPQATIYEALINTVVANALMRNNLPVPGRLKEHNLFSLESSSVIRTKKLNDPYFTKKINFGIA